VRFLDSAKIYIKSGDGGRGAIAFRREKFIEFGGPNGGNGGDGGDVYFEATTSLNTLIDFRYQQHFVVKKGESGKSKDKHGKDSEDLVIKIPIGTKVYNEDKTELLYDFTINGEKILFLKGGMGGRGNASFKSSTNRAPRFAQPGMDGTELWVWLELEILADFGIIGLPNAGKSTLINCLTSANAKTANYAFTTLQPNLGVLEIYDKQIVLADMPGLIEGASEGVGLGSKFLSHIKRCRSFVHLIDITSKDILKNIDIINNELENYQEDLLEKKQLIVLTKLDLINEDEAKKILKNIKTKSKTEVLALSSLNKQGIDKLIDYLYSEYISKIDLDTKKMWSPI
jgi:GTPase